MSSHHTAPAREPARLPSYVQYEQYDRHEEYPHDVEGAYAA
ncbi:hypothetical protein ACIF8T_38810 [Streptomyces sp. NPDC085946]